MASQMNSLEFINTSIIHSSLKYLKTFNIIKLSRWIYEELKSINYNDLKLKKAFKKKDLEIIKEIIHLNVNKELLNKYLTRYYNDYELVKLLLENNANVHSDNDYALRCASYEGHDKVVKLLLENGADIHAKNDLSLKWASGCGHNKVVKLLLENGADVHVDDDLSLKWASYYGYDKVVKILKEYIEKVTS
jgi:hypothetical protein